MKEPKFKLGDEVFTLRDGVAIKARVVGVEFISEMVENPSNYPPAKRVMSRCTYRVQIDLTKNKLNPRTDRFTVDEHRVFATKEELIKYITKQIGD